MHYAVIRKFCQVQVLAPIIILDKLFGQFGLTIGLWSKRRQVMLRLHGAHHGRPELGSKLWIAIGHYRLWKSMVLDVVLHEQIRDVFGFRGRLCLEEFGSLGQSVSNDHQRIMTGSGFW